MSEKMFDAMVQSLKHAPPEYEKGEEGIARHLLNDGWIKLPCKAGEEVFVLSRYYTGEWMIYPGKVIEITIYQNNTFVRIIGNNKQVFQENCLAFGDTVFHTLEEAMVAIERKVQGR